MMIQFRWLAIQFHQHYQTPPHHLLGNKPSAVAALKEQGFPFSFLVIGDTSGSETTETLIEMATRGGEPSFMVILGDFVKRPDIWNHRFFLTEMTMEVKPPFPVFLVPGNHDIDYTFRKGSPEERPVTPGVYQSLYGAGSFDFVFNDCLFIIWGVDLERSIDYSSYLRNVLIRKAAGRKHIFIFVHYPPKELVEYIEGSLPIPKEKELFSLLENYKVTACFFGDYHGHWRGRRKGVNLIVSGGGGRLKPSQPEWGKFQHILRVTVEQETFSEEILTINPQLGLEDLFEERVFTILFPIIQNRGWVLYLTFMLLLMMSGLSFVNFLRNFLHGHNRGDGRLR
jgi:hypothetical protein